MGGYILSPESLEDVYEIWSYLARESGVDFAGRVESALFEKFDLLAQHPGLGHKREDLTKLPVLFYRAFPFQYMIVYRPRIPLEIVGVLHAKRHIKRILHNRPE
ncbi:MAG: type II toxin-antitoxin system RelE/ParE family toxin [Bryobacterales bacterium]|nr:type II toxin-antitoxin system RelE/ParE family toxin [Bryobacterales bacterium]